MDTRVRPSGASLATGEPVTAAQLAMAIEEHSRATNTHAGTTLRMVAEGELVPVAWQVGSITLVYNSPDGL